MATVCIQMGHVPRSKGKTGTRREQEFAKAVGPMIEAKLEVLGHTVAVIGADDAVPKCDVFVALHCDGSTDANRRGASVGYPDDRGGQLAAAWKRAHQANGYAGGFLADNYTENLREYYGFGKAPSTAIRFLAEHGTTTNPADEQWLFANLDACAEAHVAAIGEIVGHPKAGVPVYAIDVVDACGAPNGGAWVLHRDGGVFSFDAPFHGSYHSLPAAKRKGTRGFTRIEPNSRGAYDIISDAEERYTFPDT